MQQTEFKTETEKSGITFDLLKNEGELIGLSTDYNLATYVYDGATFYITTNGHALSVDEFQEKYGD